MLPEISNDTFTGFKFLVKLILSDVYFKLEKCIVFTLG